LGEITSNCFTEINEIMIELFKHIFGICGEHFHPNIWTSMASIPVIATTIHYIKCKCGGWFKHKKDCKSKENENDILV
jgi:hypothetical protein